MTVFETCQNYAPEITVEYDEKKSLYVARMISHSRCYELEGPDKGALMFEVEAVLRKEVMELSHSVENTVYTDVYAKSKSKGNGRGLLLGGGGGQPAGLFGLTKALSGHKMKKIKGEQIFMKREDFTVGLGLSNLLSSFLGKGITYMAKVGGIVFVASSRRELKKKIIRHKNMITFRIMSNVRYHKNVEKRIALDRAYAKTKRLKKKKAMAKTFWKNKPLHTSRDLMWEERIDRMRDRVSDKKNQAFRLWVERIL